MPVRVSTLLVWLGLAAAGSHAAVLPVPHGTVELIARDASVEPGQSFQLGLDFRLEKGWHVYWNNPGDSGQAPRVQWELPASVKAGPIEWPVPKRLPVGPLLDYGYEDHVLLPLTFDAARDLQGPLEIKGRLRVLVCRETCIPGKAELALVLPVSKGRREITAGRGNRSLFAEAASRMPKAQPGGWNLSASATAGEITLDLKGEPGIRSAEFYPATPNVVANAAPQKTTVTGDGLKLTLKRAEDSQPVSRLEGLLSVSGSGEPATYAVAFPLELPPPAGPLPNQPPAAQSSPAAAQSLAPMLLFALLGGLILNLMPCVFPVLSIKVLSVLHSGHQDSRPKANALTYTLGILVSFWALVGFLLVLRSAGSKLGWGFQLQSPGFVAFLICFLFVFGLNLAGVFEIGQSLMGTGSGLASRTGYSGSFFTGVLATVVATPCTAPFMGTAIAFALSQSAAACFSVFTAMGLGLSLPFLLIAFVPAFGKLLPRPGRWMETLRQFMAFPVFATVIWLLWVFGLQASVDGVVRLLAALLLIALAVWVYGYWTSSRIATVLGLLLTAGAFVYAVRAGHASQPGTASAAGLRDTRLEPGWEPFTPEKLAAYRSQGKPVLIDFTAAWCLTCQVNERVAFGSKDVRQRLKRGNIALLRADWTSYDPGITETLASFGRSGVPLYVLYGPGASEKPVLLPDGVFGPSTVLHALDNLRL